MQDLPPELYEIFRESLENTLTLMDGAVEGGDLEKLGFHAHAMRGTSASYGYEALSREAGMVEMAAERGQWEAAEAAYTLFRGRAREVLGALKDGA